MKPTFRYGIDAPFWVILMLVLGAGTTIVSLLGLPKSIGGLFFGLYILGIGIWMLLYSTVIKVRHRYVILNMAQVLY